MTIFKTHIVKHITMSSIQTMVNNDQFNDYLIEEINNSDISFGNNAETFVTKNDFVSMMADVLGDITDEEAQERGYAICKDLQDFDQVVYISLGC